MIGFLDTKCSNCPRDLEDEVGRRSRRGREGWGACVWSDKLPWHSPEPWMRHCLCSWKPELPWCVMYRTGFSTLPAGPVGRVRCVETILDSSRWLTSDQRRRPDTALGLRQLGSSAVSGTRRYGLLVFQKGCGKLAGVKWRSSRWHGPFCLYPWGMETEDALGALASGPDTCGHFLILKAKELHLFSRSDLCSSWV